MGVQACPLGEHALVKLTAKHAEDKTPFPELISIREIKDVDVGTHVWPASRVLLHWMLNSKSAPSLRGTTVLELGAGCGALAMGLATWAGVGGVFASEGELEVYENLCHNITMNSMQEVVVPCSWDWDQASSPPAGVNIDNVDIMIASDIVYLGSAEIRLSHALADLYRPRDSELKGKDAWLLLADRPYGGERFVGASDLDDGIDPDCDVDGTRLTPVGRFLYACSRRGSLYRSLSSTPPS